MGKLTLWFVWPQPRQKKGPSARIFPPNSRPSGEVKVRGHTVIANGITTVTCSPEREHYHSGELWHIEIVFCVVYSRAYKCAPILPAPSGPLLLSAVRLVIWKDWAISGKLIQFAPQQRLYLRPLPQGHGSFRPTFFPAGFLARSAGCLRAFQKSCMPLMA